MKTIVLSLLLIITGLFANAQLLTLAKSFPNPNQNNISIVEFNGQKYCFFDYDEGTLTFYNTSYGLDNTITIPVPADYVVTSISYFYDKLFNLDDTYEFLCGFDGTDGKILKIFNENGEMLDNLGNYENYELHSINNELRLGVLNYSDDQASWVYDIYSLPGSVTELTTIEDNTKSNTPFPNPAKTHIYLTYDIDNTTTMNIINSKGQIIENKNIGRHFNKIRLDISDYSSGLYFYEYNSIITKFIVE